MCKWLPVISKDELWGGVCKRLCGGVQVTHVILVSPQSQLDLDFKTGLGLGLGQLDSGRKHLFIQINKKKVENLVAKGYRAGPQDLAVTVENAAIHSILLNSRDIKLTKLSAVAFKNRLRDEFNGRNIKGELDDLYERENLSFLSDYL